MAMKIPQHVIAEIKIRADIVDIVSDVVSLKRQGNGFVGLCPFHSEKTPSFTVNPERRSYHCFGCGEGGDAFDFLMKHGRMSFYEAVRDLAARYGVEVPTPEMDPRERQRLELRENLFAANRLACEFFQETLHNTAEGNKAMAYLLGRGICDEMIRAFQIGYAPGRWDALLGFLNRNRVDTKTAETAGLVIPRANAPGHYDRFRDRIMFPILDGGARVMGFGGRVLDDSLPKYLNSPETPVFNKRRSLFGLHRAKARAKDTGRLYVVEGYFDVVALHQHGIDNAVATLGTALTEEHLRQGFAKTVYLVFDADAAGVKAAMKGAELFLKWRIDAKILRLPEGEDPDSHVFKVGREGFEEAAASAMGIFDFMTEQAIGRFGLTPEGKIRTVSEMSRTLAVIDDGLVRSVYTRLVSEKVGVPEATVLMEIQKAAAQMAASTPVEPTGAAGAREPAKPSPGGRTPEGPSPSGRFESMIVQMMLNRPEILNEVRNRGVIGLFQDPDLAAIGRWILEKTTENENNVWRVVDGIDDPQQRRLLGKMRGAEPSDWPYENCMKCIVQFERSRKSDLGRQLVKDLKNAMSLGDEGLVREHLSKIHQHAKKTSADTADGCPMTSGGQAR